MCKLQMIRVWENCKTCVFSTLHLSSAALHSQSLSGWAASNWKTGSSNIHEINLCQTSSNSGYKLLLILFLKLSMDQIIKSCKQYRFHRITIRPNYSENHCNVSKSVSANCSENHYNVRLSQPTASADLNLLLGFNAAPPHFINLVRPVAKWKLHTHKNGKLLPVHASTNLLTALMNHKLRLKKCPQMTFD